MSASKKSIYENFDILAEAYFTFDEPVPYEVKNGAVNITPVSVKESSNFLRSADILGIDKNAMGSVEIIQKSYLKFLMEDVVKGDQANKGRLALILKHCLGIVNARVSYNTKGRPYIESSDTGIIITEKQFEVIRRIIMYQNIVGYDDSYMNPDIKKAIQETNELKNNGVKSPSLERKFAIITSHCGVSKEDQMKMTLRSHTLLFNEVCGNVEFITTRPICIYGGKDVEHWIFKKENNKHSESFMKMSAVEQKFGGKVGMEVSKSTEALLDKYL